MRSLALIFGIIFLVIGIGGFISLDNMLWGVFKVNFWLNTIHLFTGILACVASCLHKKAIQLYFQICGILYALIAVLGFIYLEQDILGIFANNRADTWLHMIAATNALILGYGAT